MQTLSEKLNNQLYLIQNLLEEIDILTYSQPIYEMGNATIGQHVRHTIEIVQELVNGYLQGIISYEKRKRDLEIETSTAHALFISNQLCALLTRKNKKLILIENEEDGELQLKSTYARELHFVLEHTIHHMALIKTGLRVLKQDCTPDYFGMAYSTLKYREKACAQ